MTLKALLPDNIKRWVVDPSEVSMRLVDYLLLKDPSFSATAWRKQIDAHSVWINTGPARLSSTQVQAFDVVLHSPFIQHPWTILSNESEFWVLDKPAGCGYEAGKKFLVAKGFDPLPVHRLDAMTTGLLIMAKTSKAKESFEFLFRERLIRKEYLAVVWGKPEKESGIINENLEEKANIHGGVRVQVCPKGRGQEAVTHWKRLASKNGLSLLKCEPKTGRTHQIRAHLDHIGLPIVGDREYSPEKPSRGLRGNVFSNQQLLHAYELSFEWEGELRCWKSSLKNDMKRFVDLFDAEQT